MHAHIYVYAKIGASRSSRLFAVHSGVMESLAPGGRSLLGTSCSQHKAEIRGCYPKKILKTLLFMRSDAFCQYSNHILSYITFKFLILFICIKYFIDLDVAG